MRWAMLRKRRIDGVARISELVHAYSLRDREERTRIAVNWRSSPKNDKNAEHEEDKGDLPQCNVLGTPRRGLRPRSPARGRTVTPRRDSGRRRRWDLPIPIHFRNDIEGRRSAECSDTFAESDRRALTQTWKWSCKQREGPSSPRHFGTPFSPRLQAWDRPNQVRLTSIGP